MDAPRFIADSNVGRLARWLRILGYDVTYDSAIDHGEPVRQALAEGRIILTRDTGVTLRKVVSPYRIPCPRPVPDGTRAACEPAAGLLPTAGCIFVRHDAIDDQLRQVIAEAGLRPDPCRFWRRCPLDNAEVRPVAREQVAGRVPPYTYRTQAHFEECPRCGRVYWQGSHLGRFLARIDGSLQAGHASRAPAE